MSEFEKYVLPCESEAEIKSTKEKLPNVNFLETLKNGIKLSSESEINEFFEILNSNNIIVSPEAISVLIGDYNSLNSDNIQTNFVIQQSNNMLNIILDVDEETPRIYKKIDKKGNISSVLRGEYEEADLKNGIHDFSDFNSVLKQKESSTIELKSNCKAELNFLNTEITFKYDDSIKSLEQIANDAISGKNVFTSEIEKKSAINADLGQQLETVLKDKGNQIIENIDKEPKIDSLDDIKINKVSNIITQKKVQKIAVVPEIIENKEKQETIKQPEVAEKKQVFPEEIFIKDKQQQVINEKPPVESKPISETKEQSEVISYIEYSIKSGDNLWKIMRAQYGLSNPTDIANILNTLKGDPNFGIADIDKPLRINQKIKLPSAVEVKSPSRGDKIIKLKN